LTYSRVHALRFRSRGNSREGTARGDKDLPGKLTVHFNLFEPLGLADLNR
jgi:hypothetical protein